MLAALLMAGSLGLGNLAASIAIGLRGVDRELRVRVALAFGLFEAGMPIRGLLLGRGVAHALGSQADIVGGGLLVATGAFTVAQALRTTDASPRAFDFRRARLLLLTASVSIDNLIVGFALGAYRVPIAVALTVIAVVSVALSLIGLELGDQARIEGRAQQQHLAGMVLLCVGAAIATGLL